MKREALRLPYREAGFLIVKQVEHYLDRSKRLAIAREIVKAAVDNILSNLGYYLQAGKKVGAIMEGIKKEALGIDSAQDIASR